MTSKPPAPHHPLRVLIATPLGQGGKGGIDRIMDEVRHQAVLTPPQDMALSFSATRGQGHIALSPLHLLATMARVAKRLLGLGPDVLHINLSSHGSTWRKLALGRFARACGVPYLIHLHGSEFQSFWRGASPALSARIRTLFEQAALVLVLGTVWRDFVAEMAPGAQPNIVILPNATRSPSLPPAPRGPEPLILFLGEVGERKGVPQLVEALSRLPQGLAWRAIIAGNGAVEQTRARVEALGLAPRVTLPGWVGPQDVARLLAEADILVLPSFGENLPMSVIEGMARGIAVVTTPVGAVEDIIKDGETGLLVPPGDAPALAVALERVVSDSGLRQRLGAAGQAFHRAHLELGHYFDQLVTLWRQAAGRAA